MSRNKPASVWRTAARAAVTVTAVAAMASVMPGAAFADDTDPAADEVVVGTAPPAVPEEAVVDVPEAEATQPPSTDLDDDLELPTPKPPKSSDDVNRPYCDRANIYTPSTKGAQYHKGVGPTLSNYNNTSRTARSTFTSEVSGTVGVSVTAGLTVSVQAMIAKIEAKYEVNLSASMTAKLGNSISVDTPSKKTTNAKYGVFRLKNTGTSYTIYDNCEVSAKKTVTSYTPLKVGWYLWEG
ncbi:hypothetical protein [Streptomyces geranii]|uniref:hypothetical protein n=1 Tax=Streptomyces geranii TaxID=2058923 RepID=UPI000D0455CB|nr:hypothetical protein [Streptomyces geranii]